MRVLHVIAGLTPQSGGPTISLLGMVDALRKQGVDAEVATADPIMTGRQNFPGADKDVPVWYFRSPFLLKYGFTFTMPLWLSRHAREYDLLHIHGVFCHTSLAAARAARESGIPYIVRSSGELDPRPLRKNRRLKQAFLGLSGWPMLKNASVIGVKSDFEKSAVERLGIGVPIVSIPHGVDILSLQSVLPGIPFRKQYVEVGKKQIILYLSRLDPIKGLDLLLAAVKELAQKRDDFALLIAGSGNPSFERQLRNQAASLGLEGHVIFCGFLDEEKKYAALRDADLFVLPSYHENFSLATVEAMAAGLPVLVSDQVGIHRDLLERKAGLVVPCQSEALAEGLQRLLDDKALCRGLSENARTLVEDKFSWQTVVPQLIKQYESVIARQARERSKRFSYPLEAAFYEQTPARPALPFFILERYLNGWAGTDQAFTGKRVLEIGAGPAGYSRLIAGRFHPGQVVALDLFLEQLPRDLDKAELGLVVGDCFDLPFRGESFDVVVGSLILHRFQDLARVIREIRRVLVREGVYLGIEPSLRNPVHWYRHAFTRHSRNEILIGARQFAKTFGELGFQVSIHHLNPKFPLLGKLGLSSCVGIAARR